MITPGRRQLYRIVPRGAVALVLGAVTLSLAGPAAAATCGKRVIDDWYADGRRACQSVMADTAACRPALDEGQMWQDAGLRYRPGWRTWRRGVPA